MDEASHKSGLAESAYIPLTLRAVQEDGQYASYCDELDIASCGDTIEEAFSMIAEAVNLHLRELTALGQLENELRERNIRVEFDDAPLRLRIPVDFSASNGSAAPTYQFLRQALPVFVPA